jgi:antitoxin ParD1/3/4
MATMNISLPDPMRKFVERQAKKEGFGTVSEYMRSIIREVQKRHAKQVLEAKLKDGLESGPATPMTKEDWDSIRREIRRRHAKQELEAKLKAGLESGRASPLTREEWDTIEREGLKRARNRRRRS